VLANPIPQTPNSSGSDEIVPDSSQWKFMSLRHRGELSQGEWKLQVIDNNVNQLEGCGTIGSSIFPDSNSTNLPILLLIQKTTIPVLDDMF
jgi:hypothetical protein